MPALKKISNLVLPLPVTLTTCRAEKEDSSTDNIIPLSWVGIVEYRPHMVNINIGKEKYSANIIRERKEFGLCIATVDIMEQVDMCGYTHGNKVDKFEMAKLTKFAAGKIDVSLIKECPICLECVVKSSIVMTTHEVFFAEVINTHVDERFLDGSGEPDIEKMNILGYANGMYFSLGKKLQSLYYSKNN